LNHFIVAEIFHSTVDFRPFYTLFRRKISWQLPLSLNIANFTLTGFKVGRALFSSGRTLSSLFLRIRDFKVLRLLVKEAHEQAVLACRRSTFYYNPSAIPIFQKGERGMLYLDLF